MPQHLPVDPNSQSILDKVLAILRLISEVLVHSEGYKTSLHRMVGVIAKSLDVDDCSIYLCNAKDNTLSLVASSALNPEWIGKVLADRSEGITGQCFESQQTLNVANQRHHPRYKSIPGLGEDRFNACLAVPLSFGKRNLGVLVVQSESHELFPSETVDLLRSLAPQAASMILNAELFEHTLSMTGDDHHKKAIARKRSLKGTCVSMGISHGFAYRIRTAETFSDIATAKADDPEAELELLAKGIAVTKRQTLQLEQCALSLLTEADSSIFATHLLMLDDHLLNDHLRDTIRKESVTAESAVKAGYYFFEEKFQRLPDPIFRERVIDLKDVLLRLAENLERLRVADGEPDDFLQPDVGDRRLILVAAELLPSELMRIPIDSIKGIVCEQGGETSHAAILAKALDIPAMMAVNGLLDHVHENDELILDAVAGVLYIDPDADQRADYADIIDAVERDSAGQLATVEPHPATTADGEAVVLRVNLSLLNETARLRTLGAKGIGLYRSEFLFMMRETLPSEQEQYNIFSKLVQSTNGELVTIRILDIGADKPVPCIPMPKEENPALGVRAIRLLRQRPDIMIPHLRAILRAGSIGPVRILLPMVATGSEIRTLRKQIDEVKAKLDAQSIPHGDCQVGVMIETPSILFELDRIAKYVDFFSVGSNDLLQYLFAADRGNSALAYLTNPLNSTFLQALKYIVDSSKANNIPVSICGEIAGNRLVVPLLVGLGYRELSMSPKRIGTIRDLLARFTVAECEDAAQRATTEEIDVAKLMKSLMGSHEDPTTPGPARFVADDDE